MIRELKIKGMTCGHCVKAVTEALEPIAGITDVKVDLDNDKATIYLSKDVDNEVIKKEIEEAGYEVESIKEVSE